MTKSASETDTKNAPYGSLAAIKAATSSSQLVDILLTNSFPTHVTAFSSAALPAAIYPPPSLEAESVSEIVRRIKPRYHFVAGGGSQSPPMFWEREPFVWEEEEGRITRFLSLGAFGGPPITGKKQRVCSFVFRTIRILKANVLVVLRLLNRTSDVNLCTFAVPTECHQESVH